MLKLVKYEFRKALSSMLALLGLTAALEIYFLISLNLEQETHLAISIALLMVCAFAVALFVLVRGVTSYSGELKNRSSYLIFLTPNSTRKIVASKFLYTFVNGVCFALLFAALAGADLVLVMRHFGEYERFLNGLTSMLNLYGVYVDQILYGVLFVLVYVFLSILSTIAVAYFSITVSHTLFRDRKWRWLPSLAMFAVLTWGINYLCSRFPSAIDQLVMIDVKLQSVAPEDAGVQAGVRIAADTLRDVIIPSLLPTAGVSLAVILASLFSCAALLEKKVSL